jgi:hypothetical protein
MGGSNNSSPVEDQKYALDDNISHRQQQFRNAVIGTAKLLR